MTFEEAIQFVHKTAWQNSKPGLSRTKHLLKELNYPENKLKFIHVAGTNGKGSTSAMLESILRCAGYKTGLFTSPYISRFTERVKVNGVEISNENLSRIVEEIEPIADSMEDTPTEFEIITAIAMKHFANEKCDIVVLETGMGGKLDSTNVISSPLCSVITNIGLDHTIQLGSTVEKITEEKAGIIKENCPTVTYELPENVIKVINNKCDDMQSKMTEAEFDCIKIIENTLDYHTSQSFSYKDYNNLILPLLGEHQLKNAAVVLETISVLRQNGLTISDEAVSDGLANTKWPARFEIVSDRPYFVVDGGHNPQCAETVVANLEKYFPNKRRIILFGVLADKDYMGLASILNRVADSFVTITPESPRALKSEELAEALKVFNKPVVSAKTIEDGIEKAVEFAETDGMVCSVGSLYTAGKVRGYFGL